MVLRVLIVLFCVIFSISNLMDSPAAAGGAPAFAPPPAYQCAPPVSAPAGCGPSPFGFCSGILSLCSKICGTVIGCPSAVAGAILDTPPPVFPRRRCMPTPCAPVMCAPRCYPPPMCAPAPCPPPMPTRITKCKPVASAATMPPLAYGPPPMYPVRQAQYSPPPMYPVRPAQCGPPMMGCRPHRPVGPGCMALCATLLEIPFRLCSGMLSVPDGPFGPLASTFGTTMTTFGDFW